MTVPKTSRLSFASTEADRMWADNNWQQRSGLSVVRFDREKHVSYPEFTVKYPKLFMTWILATSGGPEVRVCIAGRDWYYFDLDLFEEWKAWHAERMLSK